MRSSVGAPFALGYLCSKKVEHKEAYVVKGFAVYFFRIAKSYDQGRLEVLGGGRSACNVHNLYYRILLQCGMYGENIQPLSIK